MKGYLIEKGTEIKVIHSDGKTYNLTACFPMILPFSRINAIAKDFIRTHYSDVVEFFYVDVRHLIVVDMEKPYGMGSTLDDATMRGAI